jgi:hypothetical protein
MFPWGSPRCVDLDGAMKLPSFTGIEDWKAFA